MFEIDIGTVFTKKIITLSHSEIMEQLSLENQNTISELKYYRNNIGFFPWGYTKLIDYLRLINK